MTRYSTKSLFAEQYDQEAQCKHTIRIAFDSGVDAEFDYSIPDQFWPVKIGQRVEAPFGKNNKLQKGFCVETNILSEKKHIPHSRRYQLKKVKKVIDKTPLLDADLMKFARWISSYYVCPLGRVLAAMVPSAVKKGIGIKKCKLLYLADTDEKIIDTLKGQKQKQIINLLQQRQAFDIKNALDIETILSNVSCTKAPIKKLAEKFIIKIIEKEILPSLPVIPDGLAIKYKKVVLNQDQQRALTFINKQLASGKFGATLLYGVTDSGKTEVYIRAIAETLKHGKNAIVMLPEIALTTQTVQRFSSRFDRIAVMHSRLTASQRNVQWQRIKTGQANVVIGARSAVFAPLPNLGIIIVDEEHESSYKQDTQPRYHGRDTAIKRANLSNALCLLGSATPSLETLTNCSRREHFSMLKLPKRVMNLPLPKMTLVDLKQTKLQTKGLNLISEPLRKHLMTTLAKKEQAILLLNRRGYSSFIFCPSCKHSLKCQNCDVTLTFHKKKPSNETAINTVTPRHISSGFATCHYCLAKTLVPQKCPLCGKKMVMIGFGSQRLEEELKLKFPAACIARIDSDSMKHKNYYQLLKDFSNSKIDILAGTQMLAKGLHFPNVTCVGIINADTSLHLPDFRANERTFQLITQVAGRTGRSDKKGTVFVQTFFANQPVMKFALNNDFDGFVKEELKHRKACNLPPYWRMATVILRDKNFDKLNAASGILRETIDNITARDCLKTIVRGPIAPVINRIQRLHRMQIIVQAPDAATINKLFTTLRHTKAINLSAKIVIDVDPVNLL